MSWRKLVRGVLWVTGIFVVAMILANGWIIGSTRDRVYATVGDVPANKVALVLGTSNKLLNGSPNPYFESRIKTAAQLYHDGKTSHFILSGDNRTRYYNEPLEMKKALTKMGVPDSIITLDYAGLRTLDTIVRCKEIFGQEEITIITQSFHCYRALFISQYYGMDAIALRADEPGEVKGSHVPLREYFARAKAILDLYVLKTEPRHLGEKEPLQL
ncbi:MAG: SanA/YdcF family protein [Bacteroidota bacterium]